MFLISAVLIPRSLSNNLTLSTVPYSFIHVPSVANGKNKNSDRFIIDLTYNPEITLLSSATSQLYYELMLFFVVLGHQLYKHAFLNNRKFLILSAYQAFLMA